MSLAVMLGASSSISSARMRLRKMARKAVTVRKKGGKGVSFGFLVFSGGGWRVGVGRTMGWIGGGGGVNTYLRNPSPAPILSR